MKKFFLILIIIPLLTNCSQYTAMVNPSITLANGGTLGQASSSLASSLAMRQVKQNLNYEMKQERYCQTVHSSDLSKIFFETVDHIDCIFDPMSVYR